MPEIKNTLLKDYGAAAVNLLMIVLTIAAMLIVFAGISRAVDTVSGWMGQSKSEVVSENKELRQTVAGLVADKKIDAVVDQGEKQLQQLNKDAEKAEKVQAVKTDAAFVQAKAKAKEKKDQIQQTTEPHSEENATQMSLAIYDMVAESLCLADTTQCKGV